VRASWKAPSAQGTQRQPDPGEHRLQDQEQKALEKRLEFVWLDVDDLDRVDG